MSRYADRKMGFNEGTNLQQGVRQRAHGILSSVPLFSEWKVGFLVDNEHPHALRPQEAKHLPEQADVEFLKDPRSGQNVFGLVDLQIASQLGDVVDGILLALEAKMHFVEVATFFENRLDIVVGGLLQDANVVEHDSGNLLNKERN